MHCKQQNWDLSAFFQEFEDPWSLYRIMPQILITKNFRLQKFSARGLFPSVAKNHWTKNLFTQSRSPFFSLFLPSEWHCCETTGRLPVRVNTPICINTIPLSLFRSTYNQPFEEKFQQQTRTTNHSIDSALRVQDLWLRREIGFAHCGGEETIKIDKSARNQSLRRKYKKRWRGEARAEYILPRHNMPGPA